jgi:hypothetical protein
MYSQQNLIIKNFNYVYERKKNELYGTDCADKKHNQTENDLPIRKIKESPFYFILC